MLTANCVGLKKGLLVDVAYTIFRSFRVASTFYQLTFGDFNLLVIIFILTAPLSLVSAMNFILAQVTVALTWLILAAIGEHSSHLIFTFELLKTVLIALGSLSTHTTVESWEQSATIRKQIVWIAACTWGIHHFHTTTVRHRLQKFASKQARPSFLRGAHPHLEEGCSWLVAICQRDKSPIFWKNLLNFVERV